MGLAGKLTNVAALPLNAAGSGVKAVAGAASDVLGRGTGLLRTVGRKVNNTAARLVHGGKRNKTNKNKTNKNKNRKNKTNKNRKNKSNKNKNRKNKSNKNKD